MAIVRLLGTRKAGLTRDEIAGQMDTMSGGDLTACLEDLEHCGFIRKFSPIGKVKKGAVYQLAESSR